MRCYNLFSCSGKMILQCKHTKNRTWVAAHALPIFAQCDMCGHAPGVEHQPKIVQKILTEYAKHGEYIRGKDSVYSVTDRKKRKKRATHFDVAEHTAKAMISPKRKITKRSIAKRIRKVARTK